MAEQSYPSNGSTTSDLMSSENTLSASSTSLRRSPEVHSRNISRPLAKVQDSDSEHLRSSTASSSNSHHFKTSTHIAKDDTTESEAPPFPAQRPLCHETIGLAISHTATDASIQDEDGSSEVDSLYADPGYPVEQYDKNSAVISNTFGTEAYSCLPNGHKAFGHSGSGDLEYVAPPPSGTPNVPPLTLDGDYDNVPSTIDRVTEDGWGDGYLLTGPFDVNSDEDAVSSGSGPLGFTYRFVQDAEIGPPPFTTQHFISRSPASPVPGSHTAIQIPFGPDKGQWLHLAKNLSGSQINVAELAIFWLWSGYRYNTGTTTVGHTSTMSMAPESIGAAQRRYMIGPPDAPYPMTDSTNPPFVGPRTIIRNTGNRLSGWLIHIPRFLTKEEIYTATLNLRRICNMPHGWAYRHDPDSNRCVKRTPGQESDLIDLLTRQDRFAIFLRHTVGLDFAAQDQWNEDLAPIWVKRASIWTTPSPLSKPGPPRANVSVKVDQDEAIEADKYKDKSYKSPFTEFDFGFDCPDDDENAASTQNTWKPTFEKEEVVIQFDAASDTVFSIEGEATPDSADSLSLAGEGEVLGELPQRLVLYGGIDEYESAPVFEDIVDDALSVDEESFLRQSFVVGSPLYARLMEARDATRRMDEADTDVRESGGTAVNISQPMLSLETSKSETHTKFLSTLTASLKQHICIALPSFSGGYLITGVFRAVEEHIVRPSQVILFSYLYPERVGALLIAALMVGQFIVPLIWVLLEEGGACRSRQAVMMVAIVAHAYMGALWAIR
ncbi:Nn.00g061910.m01.CDS01 [Neocucurbitaria sp. VM-36]